MKSFLKRYLLIFRVTSLVLFMLVLLLSPLAASIVCWLCLGSKLWWLLMLLYIFNIPLIATIIWFTIFGKEEE